MLPRLTRIFPTIQSSPVNTFGISPSHNIRFAHAEPEYDLTQLNPPPVSQASTWAARFSLAVAITWVLYRVKTDGPYDILHTKHRWDDKLEEVERYTKEVEQLALDQNKSSR